MNDSRPAVAPTAHVEAPTWRGADLIASQLADTGNSHASMALSQEGSDMGEVIRFIHGRPMEGHEVGHMRAINDAPTLWARMARARAARTAILAEVRKLGGDSAVRVLSTLPTDAIARAVVDICTQRLASARRRSATTKQGEWKMALTDETLDLVKRAEAAGVPLPKELTNWLATLGDEGCANVLKAMLDASKPNGGVQRTAARGLRGSRLEDLRHAMGTHRSALTGPTERGNRLILPCVPPSEYRARMQRGGR